MMANHKNGTIYTGITSDLIKRAYEHRESLKGKFSIKHKTKRLIYFVQFDDPENAIRHEKRLKKYNRQWKINLIETDNPEWKDRWYDIIQ